MLTRNRFAAFAFALLFCLPLAACATDAGTAGTSPTGTTTEVLPTATHAPTVQPRFGGHVADFEARFGQPNDHSGNGVLHFARYAGSNIDEIILMADGTDPAAYQTIVIDLTIQAPDAGWAGLSVAEAMCAQYLPADATRIKQVDVTAAGVVGIQGKDVLYHSASLGAAIPAGNFVDASQNPTSSGSFDVYYTYSTASDPSKIVACRMLPGTQQTTA